MLQELIRKGEGIQLEFKSTIDTSAKIAKTLAAFANTSGGILLIGVEDSGNVRGVASEQQEMEKIEEAADFLCEPPLTVTYEAKFYEGRKVLHIRVEESEDKPHSIKDAQGKSVVYVRVRDKSVPVGRRAVDVLNTVRKEINEGLLQTNNIKMLLSYLQKYDSINSKRFAKLINVSERRALKVLTELVRQNILLLHQQHNVRGAALNYSLK
jgi:predicted HTH transcriptional regulator